MYLTGIPWDYLNEAIPLSNLKLHFAVKLTKILYLDLYLI